MDDTGDKGLEPVPRELLSRKGVSAVVCLAGGVFLFVMTVGARSRLLGMILPLAALVLGTTALLSKDREGKLPGFVLSGAGVLGMFIRYGPPPLKPFAAFALSLGALGLCAAGVWKGAGFFWGLKRRR